MKKSRISPELTTLNAGNAYWMAKLSKAVYLSNENNSPDEKKILHTLQQEDEGFLSVTGADQNSAQAALVEHKEYLCMVFRGTDEMADWLDNINLLSTEQVSGEFHQGFWESVEDVWQIIFSQYQELMALSADRPLFITGHSLGGAMATVVAARLTHDKIPFTSLYTFGQPRALTRKTAKAFNASCKCKFFRFQNNNDIVTRLPAVLGGYRHAGTHLYISRKRIIYKKISFWLNIFDHLYGTIDHLIRFGQIDMVKDHDMDEYLQSIREWNLK
ncbi:MAG: lipase family protein [Candidatus Electrothrix sp. AR3]|nr:lipase family protein [Candidatus Electrothrix sp. AR3]